MSLNDKLVALSGRSNTLLASVYKPRYVMFRGRFNCILVPVIINSNHKKLNRSATRPYTFLRRHRERYLLRSLSDGSGKRRFTSRMAGMTSAGPSGRLTVDSLTLIFKERRGEAGGRDCHVSFIGTLSETGAAVRDWSLQFMTFVLFTVCP